MMATENKVLDLSFPAAEDLSLDQYRWVVLAASGVRRPDNETEVKLGILQNKPALGEAAQVRIIGQSRLEMNDAIGVGSFVKAEYVSATDAGKGKDASGALAYAQAFVLEAASAEDDLASVILLMPIPSITQLAWQRAAVTTDATAGENTWSAAELIGGLMLRDPNGADRIDVTPTAALIVAGIAGAVVGSCFEFTIKNTADGNEKLTLSAGVGVTLSGNMTIGRYQSRRFLALCTDVGAGTEAVTIYDLGTVNEAGFSKTVVDTEATVGPVTYTAANLLGGLILRDPAGASRSDVSPTAALIVAAIPGAIVGSSFEFTIKNTADADEIITLTAGVGVTLSGNMAISRYCARRFVAVCTNVGSGTEEVTIYDLGTVNEAGFQKTTVTTEVTAGPATYTAAGLLGGLILRDPTGASRSDVSPTAALIVAAISNAIVGSSFEFTIKNTADAAEIITLTAGVGVSLVGTMAIARYHSRRFLAVCTAVGSGAEAVTIYDMGDMPRETVPAAFQCVFAGTHTTTGGNAAEDIEVVGALGTDVALVTIQDNGTNNVTLLQGVPAADKISCTFSGDPGADCIINYAVFRAVS
jgi:hypothetical protein